MIRTLALSLAGRWLAPLLLVFLCVVGLARPVHAEGEPAAPAAPVAASAPAAPGAAKNVEQVENPYGLDALWKGGDAIARGVLLIMAIMSMGSWYILISKLVEQTRLGNQARAAARSFWSAGSVRQGADALKAGSPFRYIAESGLDATGVHVGLQEHIDLNTWVTTSLQRSCDEVQGRLQGGLAFLATVGSTGPFVGLFGTVWGIYHALTAIGVAGQASIDKVAGPVGEALIMTAIGLAVAVPAVLGYNWLVRRNKAAMDQVRGFANQLHSVLLSTHRAGQRG
ncbi:MotA/TolQ/ExbB proton channel family protein [Derxia lacustris]|uniref:MotA/TolQ/ExbB proton channel family protein n=1 Tax=Derxia lacustris TaxID=764842 RepID=UPI000A16F423|nr:MotA/TolQ/ExbB proton channel family protein [Derxia lacustris]